MKKILLTLILLFCFAGNVFGQADFYTPLDIKQWYAIAQTGQPPLAWGGHGGLGLNEQYVNSTGLRDMITAGNPMCFAAGDANCSQFIAPGPGAIWEVRVRDGNGATLADVVLNDVNLADTTLSLASSSFLYADNGVNWNPLRSVASPATLAVNQLATASALYTYDGTNFSRWTSEQFNADGLPQTNWGADVVSHLYGYHPGGTHWDRLEALPTSTVSFAGGLTGLVGLNGTYFNDAGLWLNWAGDTMDLDNIATSTEAPYVGSFGHYHDVTDDKWERWKGAVLSAETVANTSHAPRVANFEYAYDTANTTWRWLNVVPTQGNAMAYTQNGLVVSAVLYGDNGASLDMLNVGALGELQVTDIATRPGEDAANNWRNIYKAQTAVTTPPVQTTADIPLAETDVLTAREVLSDVNWCVTLSNTGANPLTDADIYVSANNSNWITLNWAACDTLAAGVSCVYCVSANAYRWIKATASATNANKTTIGAYYTANKG